MPWCQPSTLAHGAAAPCAPDCRQLACSKPRVRACETWPWGSPERHTKAQRTYVTGRALGEQQKAWRDFERQAFARRVRLLSMVGRSQAVLEREPPGEVRFGLRTVHG